VDRKAHINTWYFVAALLLMMLIQWWVSGSQVQTVPYSEFQTLLREGKIEQVLVSEKNISAELKQPLPDGRKRIYTVRVDPEFAKDLSQYGVKFAGVVQSHLLDTLLSLVLPAVVFVALWYFVIRKVGEQQVLGGGLMAIGKSKAKVAVEKDIKVTFEDVAGVDEAKDELKEVVAFLEDPSAYGRLGAHIPKGVLLVGPPGTGKTLLAYSEKTAAQIDQAVRDLLAEAQRRATAILKQNRELLDQTAEKLLMKETLSADELPKRVSFVTVPAPAAAAGGKLAGV